MHEVMTICLTVISVPGTGVVGCFTLSLKPTNLAFPCHESLQPHDDQASQMVQSGEIVNDTVAMYTVVDDVLVLLVRYDHLTWLLLLTLRSRGLGTLSWSS